MFVLAEFACFQVSFSTAGIEVIKSWASAKYDLQTWGSCIEVAAKCEYAQCSSVCLLVEGTPLGLESANRGSTSVCQRYHNKVPQPRWLKQQKCIVSPLWSPEVLEQGV